MGGGYNLPHNELSLLLLCLCFVYSSLITLYIPFNLCKWFLICVFATFLEFPNLLIAYIYVDIKLRVLTNIHWQCQQGRTFQLCQHTQPHQLQSIDMGVSSVDILERPTLTTMTICSVTKAGDTRKLWHHCTAY